MSVPIIETLQLTQGIIDIRLALNAHMAGTIPLLLGGNFTV